MKLIIEREAALAATARAASVAARRSTIPILQNLRLEAGPGRLSVAGADLDMEAVAVAEAAVEAAGAVTVPAQWLLGALKTLPAGGQLAVELQPAPGRLTLRCGRSRFQLPTLPASDFPTMPAAGGGHRAAATDGSRLALAEGGCPEGWGEAPGVILPRQAAAELRRLIDGRAGEAALWTNGVLFRAELEGWRLTCKLIDGRFPDYVRVIPAGHPGRLELDVAAFTAALKRCAAMAADKARSVRLALSAGEVALRSRDGDGGEAEDSLDADYSGEPVEFSFNGGFLLEIAGQMAGERLAMELGGGLDPVKILDPADPGVAFVLMPQRL